MKRRDQGRTLHQAAGYPVLRVGRCSSLVLLLLLLAGCLTAGCRSSNSEMLETALRIREQDLQCMRDELLKLQFQNQALQHQLHGVYQPGTPIALKVAPEVASQAYGLRRITLGRSTSGYDDEGKHGDMALQVVIEPRDVDDHIIKAPGSAEVTALEISAEGLKAPIGTWHITEDQLRRSWKQGLFTNGYVLILPWQQPPRSKNVRVVVRFRVLDGRAFEADRDIIVRPPPVMPGANGHPPLPPLNETLPVPAPANPGAWPPPGSPGPGGPHLQPTSHWQVPGLEGSFQLGRPVPVYPEATAE